MNAIIGPNQGIPCVIKNTGLPLIIPDLSGIFSAEPELSDWVSRVQAQGSDVTGSGVQTAVRNFIVGMKTDGLWSKAKRIGIYCGNDLNAFKAPLVNVSGSTTDTLINFVSSDYNANGLTGNISPVKYIETGFSTLVDANFNANDFSIGSYTRTISNGGVSIGAQTAGDATRGCYITSQTNTTYASNWDNNGQVAAADTTTSATGSYLNSRIASNDLRIYKNGVQIGSTSTSPGTNTNGFTFRVHDGNLSNAIQWAPSTQQICFYWIGKGLTSTQAANLYTRVQALQTALGRQV